MITRIEALGYRCLRYVSQPLAPFHVLVGPNASGKTTFLDVIAFLGRLVSEGIDAAVGERTQNFYDLVWHREGKRFELAVEAAIPEALRRAEFDTVRYEVAIGIDPETQELGLDDETVILKIGGERLAWDPGELAYELLFDEPFDGPWVPSTILSSKGGRPGRMVLGKAGGASRMVIHGERRERQLLSGDLWADPKGLGPRLQAGSPPLGPRQHAGRRVKVSR